MAESNVPKVVVDANVLIAFLHREEGRYERSRDLLDEAEDGLVEVWAPAVILVEVARWREEVDVPPTKAQEMLDDFLDSDWLRIVEIDRRLASIARRVVASTSVRTGVDALYIAAGVVVGADAVYSWDDDDVVGVTYEGVSVVNPPGSDAPKLDFPASSQE